MAFTHYRSTDDVVRRHGLHIAAGPVLAPCENAPPFSDAFRGELTLSLTHLRPTRSELGAGEVLLFPILREVWKNYLDRLSLFTHELLEYDDDLTGFPDYFVCRLSPQGRITEVPYLLVVEAKLDDFERGWAQCLAAMLAAQKLNASPEVPVYGIVSNGRAWEFGELAHSTFTRQPGGHTIMDLDRLGAQLHAVFRACAAQVQRLATP